jgi:predicted ATPase/DNA-binding winged helix-turn-helix (wHTH) protein
MDWISMGVLQYRFDEYCLLPDRRALLRSGEPVQLTRKALSVLLALVERNGRIVSKDELYSVVWGDIFVEESNLTVQISILRKALGSALIQTIPGRGYRIAANIVRLGDMAPSEPNDIRQAAAAPTTNEAGRNRTNLPHRLDALIGRTVEAVELIERLAKHRLVTLTGVGGVGKTSLALELGCRMVDRFADGVWLADLAPLSNPGLIPSALAVALQLTLEDVVAPIETIAKALEGRRLLLLLDNCEHLVANVASALAVLLSLAPGVSVLATSQEILGLSDEQVYRLEPLAAPPSGAGEIGTFDAVKLFVARAAAADRRFALTTENGEVVADICRRLDGNPLALEMAAARLQLLGLGRLREGLDRPLQLLRHGARGALSRHGSLRDVVEWSYNLLEAPDRRLFDRLAVFPSSFSLDATLAIAGDEGADRYEVMDALGRLVDKSLVSMVEGDEPRYRLLEFLRHYARERLDIASERSVVMARHARYFTDMFDTAYRAWQNMPDVLWAATYRPELDNLRAAMDWALTTPERAKIAIALAGAAGRLWVRLSLFGEGRRYVDPVVTLITAEASSVAAARVLIAAATLSEDVDRGRALALREQAVAICRSVRAPHDMAVALRGLALDHQFFGRRAAAQAILLEAHAILAGSSYVKTFLMVTNDLGVLATITREPEAARRWFIEALALAQAASEEVMIMTVRGNLGELECTAGRFDEAIAHSREAAARFRATGPQYQLAAALVNLSRCLILADNLPEGRSIAAEVLPILPEIGGSQFYLSLQLWAALAAAEARYE